MPLATRIRMWLCGVAAIAVAGCVAIPIPEKQEAVVFGHAFAQDEQQTALSATDTLQTVKEKFGEPALEFGPGRIVVYLWTTRYGNVHWLAFTPTGGGGGKVPQLESHMLLIAFDTNGKLLKSGTAKFVRSMPMANQVKAWLSANSLADQVVGPRPESGEHNAQILFVYRPASCPFNAFSLLNPEAAIIPSVAVDDHVVGEIMKGEYLATEITPGPHELTLDPWPKYRYAGEEDSAPALRAADVDRTPQKISINAQPERELFIEVNVCNTWGGIKLKAAPRDSVTGHEALKTLRPAW